MSRCYPYPPPGYKEKAQVVDLGLSTKKAKHRDKGKKKKKRRDSEANGDSNDKDKRPKKIRQTKVAKDVHHMENGRLPESNPLSTTAAAVDYPLDRTEIYPAGRPGNQRHFESTSCQPTLYSKEQEANGKVEGQPPVILASYGTKNSTGVGIMATSRHNLENHNDVVRQRHPCSLSQVEGAWSAVDDQDWLFLHNNNLHLRPKAKVEEGGGTACVWAQVLHLPSVDMYALPYVVPY